MNIFACKILEKLRSNAPNYLKYIKANGKIQGKKIIDFVNSSNIPVFFFS